ncbi:hypothetical protein HAX54_004279, partial [Datura stramonium]|nr:hypothetical protein [Datura stramonium]
DPLSKKSPYTFPISFYLLQLKLFKTPFQKPPVPSSSSSSLMTLGESEVNNFRRNDEASSSSLNLRSLVLSPTPKWDGTPDELSEDD